MKVGIEWDERYPVFKIVDDEGYRQIEATPEQVAEWRHIARRFDSMQQRIGELASAVWGNEQEARGDV